MNKIKKNENGKKKIIFWTIFGITITVPAILTPILLFNKTEKKEDIFEKNQNLFNNFDQKLTISISPLENGTITKKTLENLLGHQKLPKSLDGVVQAFSINTNLNTGIAAVTVTLSKDGVQKQTSYQITGFKTSEQQAIDDSLNKNKNLFNDFDQRLSDSITIPLANGNVTKATLEALNGHQPIPRPIEGIVQAFSINTDLNTGIATVIVTLSKDGIQKQTSYQITRFKTSEQQAIDDSLNKNKNLFNNFNQRLSDSITIPLANGNVTKATLEALNGHQPIPRPIEGIVQTFSINTDLNTGIATVTVTLSKDGVQKQISYQIIGFQTSEQQAIDDSLNKNKNLFNDFDQKLIIITMPLTNENVTKEVLENLPGHQNLPLSYYGVEHTFSINTNLNTGIATVTVTLSKDGVQKQTSYQIVGFKTSEQQAIDDSLNKNKNLFNHFNQRLSDSTTIPLANGIVTKATLEALNGHRPIPRPIEGVVQSFSIKIDANTGIATVIVTLSKDSTQKQISYQIERFKNKNQIQDDINTNKNLFNNFNQRLSDSTTIPLANGIVTKATLEALNGHRPIPRPIEGVVQSFSIKIDANTGIATVTVNLSNGDILDHITYQIQTFVNSGSNITPAKAIEFEKIISINIIKDKFNEIIDLNINLDIKINERNEIKQLQNTFKTTINNINNVQDIQTKKDEIINKITDLYNKYKNQMKTQFIHRLQTNYYTRTDEDDFKSVLPKDFAIPNGIEIIPSNSFDNLIFPKKFNFPNSIKTIESHAIKDSIFKSWFSLPQKVTVETKGFINIEIQIKTSIPQDAILKSDAFFGIKIPPFARWEENSKKYYNYPKPGTTLKRLTNRINKIQNNDNINDINKKIYKKTLKLPPNITEIGESAFDGVKIYGTFTLKENTKLKKIGEGGFLNSKLPANFELPNSLKEIGDHGFQNVKLPINFRLPINLKKIGKRAFYGAKINLNFRIPVNTNIDVYAFKNALLPNGFQIPNSDLIDANAFDGAQLPFGSRWFNPKSEKWISTLSINNINTPEKRNMVKGIIVKKYTKPITSIWSFEFLNNKIPSNYQIPKTVTEIYPYAFKGAFIPKGFTLPNRITKIRTGTFFKADISNGFTLPSSLQEIESYAFKEVYLKDGFTLPNGITKIGQEAFKKAILPNTFVLPKNLEGLERGLFWGARLPDKFILPSNIKYIKAYAFKDTILPNDFVVPSGLIPSRNAFEGAKFKNGNPFILRRSK